MIDLRLGDCLEVMKTIEDNSIDAIITDPPYGTTSCKWDSVIPFDLMWEQLNRIIKPNGAIVLFCSEPFSSALRMSNIKNYKYDWIWDKKKPGAIGIGKFQPLRYTENITVFNCSYQKYNPQMVKRDVIKKSKNYKKSMSGGSGLKVMCENKKYTHKFPKNIIEVSNASQKGKQHPTQKPIELMEYLIKTYTKENETVLDFTMGSGSTMVAAQNLKRNGIGIEQDEKYFKIAEQRIKENEFKLF
jgi:site-specific DNA-methyltransferase (adenine-specific)